MSVSAIGQGISVAAIRHAVATATVFLGLFFYFYGPPLTEAFDRAAHRECNQLTGSSYRGYVLEWQTTTLGALSVPHWQCYDKAEPDRTGTDLGWWVGL